MRRSRVTPPNMLTHDHARSFGVAEGGKGTMKGVARLARKTCPPPRNFVLQRPLMRLIEGDERSSCTGRSIGCLDCDEVPYPLRSVR